MVGGAGGYGGVGPVALVVLIVATIGGTELVLHPRPAEPVLPAERVSLPGYPADVVTQRDALPLPTDRAVGLGLMVYV